MHARLRNPSSLWQYLVAAGLVGAGAVTVLYGRKLHAASTRETVVDGGGADANGTGGTGGTDGKNGSGGANGTEKEIREYPPMGPKGWHQTLTSGHKSATHECFKQGATKDLDTTKACVLSNLFPHAQWPPKMGRSKQWQFNAWHNSELNAYVSLLSGTATGI